MQRQTFTILSFFLFCFLAMGQVMGQKQLPQAWDLYRILEAQKGRTQKMESPLVRRSRSEAPSAGRLRLSTAPLGGQNTISVPRQEVEYKWEGGAWQQTSTNTMTYTAQGLLQEQVNQPTAPSKPATRETYTYNNAGRLLTQLIQVREGQTWVNTERLRYTYNAVGAVEEEVYEMWHNGEWMIEEGLRYAFTLSGAAISEVNEQEYVSGTGWVNSSKASVTYENNQIKTWTQQDWDKEAGAWDTSEGYIRYTNIVWQDWNGFMQAVLQAQSTQLPSYLTYIKSATQQGWDPTTNQWVNEARFTNTTEPGSITIVTDHFDEGNWAPAARLVLTSDDKGNLTSIKTDAYLGTAWLPAMETRLVYTYDAQDNLTELVMQMMNLLSQPPMPTLTNVSRSVFSEFQVLNVTGVEDPLLSSNTKVYPNPTSRDLHIELNDPEARGTKVTLFNLTGQKVHEQSIGVASRSVTIEAANLPKGVYLLRLVTADNRSLTRRVIRN